MRLQLKQQFQIESARFLPNLPPTHPCARMHGHSFKITLGLEGEIDPQMGWVMDYNEIKAKTKPILEEIDHRVLNQVPGLENPTTERLCIWLFEKLKPELPQLFQVSISETNDSECIYQG